MFQLKIGWEHIRKFRLVAFYSEVSAYDHLQGVLNHAFDHEEMLPWVELADLKDFGH